MLACGRIRANCSNRSFSCGKPNSKLPENCRSLHHWLCHGATLSVLAMLSACDEDPCQEEHISERTVRPCHHLRSASSICFRIDSARLRCYSNSTVFCAISNDWNRPRQSNCINEKTRFYCGSCNRR